MSTTAFTARRQEPIQTLFLAKRSLQQNKQEVKRTRYKKSEKENLKPIIAPECTLLVPFRNPTFRNFILNLVPQLSWTAWKGGSRGLRWGGSPWRGGEVCYFQPSYVSMLREIAVEIPRRVFSAMGDLTNGCVWFSVALLFSSLFWSCLGLWGSFTFLLLCVSVLVCVCL